MSGDVINSLGGVSETAHIIAADIHGRILGDARIDQISAEIGPENTNGIPWEGNDNNDDSVAATAAVDYAENEKREHDVSVGGEYTIESSVGRSSGDDELDIDISSVADSDELAHIDRVEGKSFEQVSMDDKKKTITKWPNDDDARVQSKLSAAKNGVTLGDIAYPTSSQVSVDGKHDLPHDRPDDDDDVAVERLSEISETIISENEVEDGGSRKGETSSTKGLPLNEDDDDDDDDVNTAVGSTQSDDMGVLSATVIDGNENSLALSTLHSQPTTYHRSQSSEGGETTEETIGYDAVAENGKGNVAPEELSDTNAKNSGSDLSIPSPEGNPNETILPNQDQSEEPSIVGNGESDTSVSPENIIPEGNPDETILPNQDRTDQASIVENDGSNLSAPPENIVPEDNPDETIFPNQNNDLSIPPENIAPEGKPNETIVHGQGEPEQPFIQDWGDEEEESLFETIQSTFNVILLAMSLTSLLVFRKRVNDRVRVNPSLSVSNAIKDETIDVVIRIVSWATSKSWGARGNIDSEVGNDALSGFGSSGISETIALSTATDEEWGWEDEEIGAKLELSAMEGNEAKEDDDLAMAIAMSISDTKNGSDKATGATSSVHKPINPSNMNGSKYSPSTSKDRTLRPSPISNFTSTSFETPSYSTGGDSIADLLGQMGGTSGSVIKSFGQKPVMKTKPKPQPKNESADDIFAEMGLSTSYRSTAASRPPMSAPKHVAWQDSNRTQSKADAPKSAKLPSLLADTIDGDVDADTWGDDGDLDDLLD